MGTEDSDEPSGSDDQSPADSESDGDVPNTARPDETEADAGTDNADRTNTDEVSADADSADETSSDDTANVDAGSGDPSAAFEDVHDEQAESEGELPGPAGETSGPDDRSPAPESEGVLGSGPESDQEMPLADHIEEMVRRLAAVVVVAGVVTAITFPFGEEIINFLWYSLLPSSQDASPHIYSPPELLITQLKVASLAGVIAALPVLVYQSYRFMRPGLYPHERRYYLAAVPTSLVLAFVGVTFAYFIVLPAVFTYFYNYTEGVSAIAFALGRTFDLILVLMGYLALVFQIPLFIMLAMMMGLVTRAWLADRRLLFWGGFLGVSFFFSPDPTGMSPLIITVTMIVLFEATLLLAKWAGKG